VSRTAHIGWSLAFGLGIANVAELGTEGIQRFAIGLGISVIVTIVRIADERGRSGKSFGGAVEVVHKLGTVLMFLGAIAWAVDYAVPWSGYLGILGVVAAAVAWYSVYLPSRSVSEL
jgi:hypothetical protein